MYEDEASLRAAVAEGRHREVVGGLWEDIGTLQRDFLVQQGLMPHHKLIDIGCGALRAGVKLIPYLEPGNYYGIDISPTLLDAGYEREIVGTSHEQRMPRNHLAVTGSFQLAAFETTFDFAIAQSVFTHLPRQRLVEALHETAPFLRAGAIFFSTWFVAPDPGVLDSPQLQPHGIETHYDRDPFHSSVPEIVREARQPGWVPVWIGEWEHPRSQQMLAIVRQ